MIKAVCAGVLYFLAMFAVGFVLGTIRVLMVMPGIGETAAVLVEMPVILTASWFVCGFLIRKFQVTRALFPRMMMGASALALLLAAETLLGLYGFDRGADEQLAHYATLAGAIGLAGQIVFGLFPVVQLLFKDAGR